MCCGLWDKPVPRLSWHFKNKVTFFWEESLHGNEARRGEEDNLWESCMFTIKNECCVCFAEFTVLLSSGMSLVQTMKVHETCVGVLVR